MSVNFRWKTPNVIAAKSDPEGIGSGLTSLGEAIARMKASRYAKEQQDRRNAIEDENRAIAAEDRRRRIQAEDKQQKLYGETASLIRSRKEERSRLVNRRNEITARIAEIESRLK
jgi:hypothetical protein